MSVDRAEEEITRSVTTKLICNIVIYISTKVIYIGLYTQKKDYFSTVEKRSISFQKAIVLMVLTILIQSFDLEIALKLSHRMALTPSLLK